MKKVLIIIAEFFLFLLVDVIGGVFYHPFHIQSALQGARSFVWDGVLLMLIAWLLLVVIALARKRLVLSTPPLTVALVLAGIAGFLLKVGFITHNW